MRKTLDKYYIYSQIAGSNKIATCVCPNITQQEYNYKITVDETNDTTIDDTNGKYLNEIDPNYNEVLEALIAAHPELKGLEVVRATRIERELVFQYVIVFKMEENKFWISVELFNKKTDEITLLSLAQSPTSEQAPAEYVPKAELGNSDNVVAK